ncbi:restriction endonuclease subunit S [Klebsiella quasipneumoniae]|uniref:restriction endonuclease subunit S n=1 Tax=Klebsiella quasipneumoniae TaxID=1463165 RepID=UPI000CFC7349|nr:restriction endonuclease subunit S [Klebsiella quasipneumoniae]PQM77557.1 restriction endonuclease subunit S [Klebsiella quasipneumoniae]PQM86002.1 restriction endonuclease subunit S [Klebsiella quasipneumoniae]
MAKYKAYPEYKDSGVEWLGAIPEDWSVTKLKYIADLLTAKSTNSDDLFVGLENISSGDGKYISKEENIADGASVSFEKNDVLFGKLRPYLAKSWLATFSGVCSSEFLVLRTAKLHPKYLNYFSLTNEFIDQVNSSTYGSKMPRASWEFIGLLPVPTCSYSLSEKVAEFLDYETAKIDNLIEKQQQLIELLKEKRQAVISHAVTKGLNPDVPMKDSGVEWLGEVPGHWKIKRCKNLFNFVTSGSRGWAGFYSDEGDLFFRIANLTRDSINPKLDSIQYVTPPKGSEGERSKIKENDLLISITADLGSVCAADESISGGYVSQHVSLCRPGRAVASSRWLAYFVLSDTAKEQLQGAGYGGTKIQLSLEDIRDLFVAYPPKSEQIKIASYLDERLSDLDGLDHRAHNLIELLRERRTALISAAVTGKIDVRDWVAPDTQNIEETQEATA